MGDHFPLTCLRFLLMRSFRLRFYAIMFSVLCLAACGEKEEGMGRYGMLADSTPEYSAVTFLKSVYEDDNLDVAISLSSDRLARILTNYHSNRNVQRHLLNLKYDTVIITPQSGNSVGRSEFSEKATVTVFLSGMYDDDKIEDLRSLDLIKEDGMWKVSQIHPDHFM